MALFQEQLDCVIREQDLSEEKLKRAFELKINIPKFKGCDSEVDIYTFRSEFEKLVEPAVPTSIVGGLFEKGLFGRNRPYTHRKSRKYRYGLE